MNNLTGHTLEKRRIPRTQIAVSPICLGTMTFGTPVNETDAIELVSQALDHDINFIDTANMYEGYARTAGSAGGVAEEILGKVLKSRRNEVILATKIGMKVGDKPEDDGTSPAAIQKQLEKSLQRLATDYIDIYYLHRPDPNVPVDEILFALDKAMKEGKIRHYGVSNFSAEQLENLLKAADAAHLPRPVILQPHYSLLNRDAETGLLPLCQQYNIAVAPYRILESGLLTGKYLDGSVAPSDSRMKVKPEWMPKVEENELSKLKRIKYEAEQAGVTMTEYTVQWTLKQTGVVSLVLGVKRPDQLVQAVNAASD